MDAHVSARTQHAQAHSHQNLFSTQQLRILHARDVQLFENREVERRCVVHQYEATVLSRLAYDTRNNNKHTCC
jgi:hypothetical protein